MGSVVIAGSTSGTVTITPPAEAGTRTITLPAATGTAILEDGSNNLQMNSGFGSSATAYGVRAWVNFNGSGTPAIRESGNVSSITDNGTGVFTINFATNMPDVDYAVSGQAHSPAAVAAIVNAPSTANGNQAVGSVRIVVINLANNGGVDCTYISTIIIR